MVQILKNIFIDRTFGVARSTRWPTLRRDFLNLHPACEVCGTKLLLNVHHKIPVHIDSLLELDPRNLVTLCFSHHLWWGHLGKWASYNNEVDEWINKIKTRP